MKHTVVGLDTAKRVFQLHWVDQDTGEIVCRQLKRERLLEHFADREPCLVGMEACGGSQHWARELIKLGHEVKLLPGKQVKPFVLRNKSDAADARAIWTAVQQPKIKGVAVKTETQQAVLALHRMRSQLLKFRVAQGNGLRGLLAEYGEVMPQGKAGLANGIVRALQRVSERVPALLVETLHEQWQRVAKLDEQIAQIERRLAAWLKQDRSAQCLARVPGIGLLGATATAAVMGDPRAFKSGREFAAWLGLTPTHSGTGGKVRMLGISKRGDAYVRTLLIHGARAVLTRGNHPPEAIKSLAARRPLNVAVVALANKMARIAWALLAHGREYRLDYSHDV